MSQPHEIPPEMQLMRMILQMWVPQAIHAAAELGLADALADRSLTGAQLASRLQTDADATERLAQALVVLGVLRVDEGRFALTPVGACLRHDAPASRRAWSRLMGGPGVWSTWGRLVDCVRTGRMARRVDDPSVSESVVFDEMASDPAYASLFHRAMTEGTGGQAAAIAASLQLDAVSHVVDVGGGSGALLAAVLARSTSARGTVFDLSHARAAANELLGARGLAERATFVEGDLFESSPPSAELFLLKSVVHDWDDRRALRILGKIRDAMRPGDRLALIEPPSAEDPAQAVASPMGWIMAFSDLNMLVNCGGRERTAAEYQRLLERADLRVVRTRPAGFYVTFEATRA